MIPVYVNGRSLSRLVTGVERYTREVLRRLPEVAGILAPNPPVHGAPGHLWEQFRLPRLFSAPGVLWSPANTGPLQVRSQVLTIHDLSPLEHPEWFRRAFSTWYRWFWPPLSRRVRRILTPSEFSRDRIVRRLHVPAEKVEVVPCGVDTERFRPRPPAEYRAVLAHYRLTQPYLLALGTLQPRKNLPVLLQAWEQIHASRPDLRLVIAGAPGRVFRPVDLDRLPDGVHLTGYLPESHLPAVLGGAALFISPGQYEGFGLSALEALACGTPVLAAGGGGQQETLGPAGRFFPPGEAGILAAEVLELLDDPLLRRELGEAGRRRAREFTWERTAAAVWNLLQAA